MITSPKFTFFENHLRKWTFKFLIHYLSKNEIKIILLSQFVPGWDMTVATSSLKVPKILPDLRKCLWSTWVPCKCKRGRKWEKENKNKDDQKQVTRSKFRRRWTRPREHPFMTSHTFEIFFTPISPQSLKMWCFQTTLYILPKKLLTPTCMTSFMNVLL